MEVEMGMNVFIYMSVLAYGATEVIKAIINVYKPELKIGLVIAFILGLSFDLGLGVGLVSFLSGIQYEMVYIPILFKITDIFTTGAILSLGSKGLNAILEKNGVDVAGSINNGMNKIIAKK
jgi:hypothetical protein